MAEIDMGPAGRDLDLVGGQLRTGNTMIMYCTLFLLYFISVAHIVEGYNCFINGNLWHLQSINFQHTAHRYSK